MVTRSIGTVTFESQLEDRIANLFQELGVTFTRGKPIGGLRPDFVVESPQGKMAVVEVKGWEPTGGNTARALRQAKQYKQATNADLALIVMPKLKRNFFDEGLVNEEGLLALIHDWLSKNWIKIRRIADKPPTKEKAAEENTVFAAMPFDRKYDDTFFVAMRYAAKRVDAVCERVDRTEFSGDIVEEIKRLIRRSIAVIVDLSETKENVLYEAGFAHALDKPTVHICSTDLSRLPFDVRNWNTIPYDLGGTVALQRKLAARLAAVL
jgi:hypothetical protein